MFVVFDDVVECFVEVFVVGDLFDVLVCFFRVFVDFVAEVAEELLCFLFLFALVSFVFLLEFGDASEAEVDMAFVFVDLDDLADDAVAFVDIVADVSDASAAYLGDVDEAAAAVRVEFDEDAVVLDVGDFAED